MGDCGGGNPGDGKACEGICGFTAAWLDGKIFKDDWFEGGDDAVGRLADWRRECVPLART